MLRREQDEILSEIHDMADGLHEQSKDIQYEIHEQGRAIDHTKKTMDETQKRMGFVMGKLSKLLKTSDAGLLYTICVLMLILIGMVFLITFV